MAACGCSWQSVCIDILCSVLPGEYNRDRSNQERERERKREGEKERERETEREREEERERGRERERKREDGTHVEIVRWPTKDEQTHVPRNS